MIGDSGRGVFVRRGVPECIRERLVPAADIVTPNQFELDYLTGHKTVTRADALAAIEALRARGPRVVMVTSLRVTETPEDCVDLLASDETDTLPVAHPAPAGRRQRRRRRDRRLVLCALLRQGRLAEALSRAASSMFGVLSRTAEEGAGEMLLVAAQEEFVKPSQVFRARPIGK